MIRGNARARRDGAARQTRVVRGVACAAVATTFAATAHTLAGGGAPPAWLLLAVTILAAPPAVALVREHASRWRTLAVVVLAQAMLHGAFALAGSPTPAAGGPGHLHGTALLAGTGHASGYDVAMLAGHLAAAAVTAALLAHGERLLAALGRGIRSLLHARVPAVPAGAPPRRRCVVTASLRRAALPRPWATALSRRGPPAFAR